VADVAAEEIARVAVALARGGSWDAAETLLDAAEPKDSEESAALALARATVHVERDVFGGGDASENVLVAARTAVAAVDDAGLRWDLDFLTLRRDYTRRLRDPGEGWRDLDDRCTALVDAPDRRRGGWAIFYRGLVEDRSDDPQRVAAGLYERALAAANEPGDDLLASYALRHLGDHADDASRALELANRSFELRARIGFVPGALAQQVLLAAALREAGDEAGSRAALEQTLAWASALGIGPVVDQCGALLASGG
jgi:hypothetical protein